MECGKAHMTDSESEYKSTTTTQVILPALSSSNFGGFPGSVRWTHILLRQKLPVLRDAAENGHSNIIRGLLSSERVTAEMCGARGDSLSLLSQ
eukprot:2258417-Amphidinium_carterae.1